jgi:hypothetical protein
MEVFFSNLNFPLKFSKTYTNKMLPIIPGQESRSKWRASYLSSYIVLLPQGLQICKILADPAM